MHFNLGQDESIVDKIRSILAQMEYQYQICEWERKGVDFYHHIYVPKIHPITNEPFYEMEDEAHVFKVCGQSCGKAIKVFCNFKLEDCYIHKARRTREVAA